jgi:hypothetical protein
MRLAHIFFDCHMANGHAGLESIMGNKKLKPGDCAIFVNTAWDTVKIFVDGNFIAHYKHPTGTIAPETLRHLPNYLQGGEIQYSKALKKVIEEHLENR